jgi:DNA gyrase subunit A
MVINKSGITIRIGVDTLRVMGRATQGVKIIRLRDEDSIASVASVSKWEEEEEVFLDEEGNVIENVIVDAIENKETITDETSTEENEDNNTNKNNEENEEN